MALMHIFFALSSIRAVGLYRAAVRLRLLAAADEKNVLEVVAVLAEPAQHAPQYPKNQYNKGNTGLDHA